LPQAPQRTFFQKGSWNSKNFNKKRGKYLPRQEKITQSFGRCRNLFTKRFLPGSKGRALKKLLKSRQILVGLE
jgi:hypothetical protein